ncbi:MAG: hypothetical protein HOP18_10025 [Deltaproteobacteria bacterium]|nr:hypothetical protein [Deltaproteobacteria bacterium]
MNPGQIEESRLQIRRVQAQYLVSSAHPAPERVKARLDEALTHQLAQTLSATFASWFSDTDPSIWVIRQLEINVDVNTAWERESLTRPWAQQIARELGAVMHDGEDRENVVRFPTRAAFLARFLIDAAEGRAWAKWYYESFAGLRLLPTSAALRTAIVDRPTSGRAALLELSPDELKKVLCALTTQDARTIVDRLAAAAPSGDALRCFEAVWATWRTIDWDSFASVDEWRNVLRLYLAVSRDHLDVDGLPLQTAVLALLRLARCLVSGSAAQGQQLLTALTSSDLAGLYAAAGTANAEALAPLSCCPPAWVREVGQILIARHTGLATDDEEAAPGPRSTAFGGVFLLLPLLDELPLAEATYGWPHADEAAAITLVRALLLLKCCGRERARRAFYDPLLRDLLLLPPTITPEVLADWQAGISAANVQAFLETFVGWHSARGAVHGEKLILARIAARGAPTAVLIDGTRGHWLCAMHWQPHRPERLIATLQSCLAQTEQAELVLLSDPAFFTALRSAFPDRRIASLADDAVQTIAEKDERVAEIVARLDKLPADLSHLSLPQSFGLRRAFDLALSVAAQGVMRSFAWRLPGFAGSNLPYLSSNFLDFAGSVDEEPARRVVRVGRPPLHLVLNITGMTRRRYGLSWLDDRPLALFPEG